MSKKSYTGRNREVIKLKRNNKLSASSKRWLQRQLNDPYVNAAKTQGYRARSAFKLLEVDDKFHLFRPGMTVLDLGAAPGSWSQVACEKIGRTGTLVALDILDMEPVAGTVTLQLDIYDERLFDRLASHGIVAGGVDVVLSDMAANTTGDRQLDHLRTIALVEAAVAVAQEMLKKGGHFVSKVFQGGTSKELLQQLKSRFTTVKHYKPPASRKESPEIYVVAKGFKG